MITVALTVNITSSCDSDDDHSTTTESSLIDGKWDVSNISGGFTGIHTDYKPGIITWEFDSKKSQLTVVNNSASTKNYSGLQSGQYTFSIFELKKAEYISIEGTEHGQIEHARDIIIINQNKKSTGSYSDHYIMTFRK